METLKKCPLCGAVGQADPFIHAIDHLVTRKVFSTQKCRSCKLVYTNPRPFSRNMHQYYVSDRYVSHADTPDRLLDRIYGLVRKFMAGRKIRMMRPCLTKSATILDVGCGTGVFLHALQKKGYHVMGVEPGKKAAELAASKGIVVRGSLEELAAESPHTFDAITLWHVLEHIADPVGQLGICRQLLKPTGVLLVATPMCNSFDAAFYKQHWAAWDVPRHLMHFTPETLQSALQKAGFAMLKTRMLPFDAFYISILSEQNMQSWPKPLALLRALFIGMLSNISAAASLKPASSKVMVCQPSAH